MRPTRHRQDPLETPLNEVLGRESQVRVLRALSVSGRSLSVGDLAARTRLDISGIKRVLAALIQAGLLEFESHSSENVRLNKTYPLLDHLIGLFQAEHDQAQRIERQIRDSLLHLASPPIAAWLSFSDMGESPGRVNLGILADRRVIDESVHILREMIAQIPIGHAAFVEVNGLTPEDLRALDVKARKSLMAAKPLLGIHPLTILAERTTPQGVKLVSESLLHAVRDIEALDLARLLAKKIARDPSLISRAKQIVEERQKNASQWEANDLREWQQLLATMSVSQLGRFLTDSGERAVQLRQSLPFAGLISEDERAKVRARLKSK